MKNPKIDPDLQKSEDRPSLIPKWINSHALSIVKTLQGKGHTTYLVGGCVRDLLLGKIPKDYDIATDARPYEVKKAIHNAYVIGRRFRLVLVKREEQTFEVATFRKSPENIPVTENDDPPGDNVFGTPLEDAKRRDFTINGLFYDPVKNQLLDYVGGLKDLKAGIIRMIGEPDVRLLEDPIRILRAVRLSHMIRFSLEPGLRSSMQKNATSLAESVLPRRREELLKFLRLSNPSLPILECFDLGLLKFIAPQLESLLSDDATSSSLVEHLAQFHTRVDWESPMELFGGLIWAVINSVEPSRDPLRPIVTNDILENSILEPIMKDELGMFKYEQAYSAKALHMQNLLARPTEFLDRDSSRKMALFSSEAFPLALKYAKCDYAISQKTWIRWANEFEKVIPAIQKIHESKSDRRSYKTKRRAMKRRRPNTN